MELAEYVKILWRKRWIVLAAFLSTFIATAAIAFRQTPVYRASATYIITPTGAYEDAKSMADAVDLLSRRTEIAGTYAEVAASTSIKSEAGDELGLTQGQRKSLSTTSRLLADTNVLEITVEGNDPQLVWIFADTVGVKTAAYIKELYEAFDLRPLDPAAVPNSPFKPNMKLNLALGAILGLGLGAGLAFLARYVEVSFEPAIAPGMSRGTLVGSTGRQSEDEGALEDTAVTEASKRGGRPRLRLKAWGWIAVATVAAALLLGSAALWLSGRGTSAAVLPTDAATLAPWGRRTSTAITSPTDTVLPVVPPSPTSAPEPSATPCPIPIGWLAYEVQVGDTLSSLADRHNVTIAEITDANCIDRRVISAGQIVHVPGLPETPTPTPGLFATDTVTISVELTPTAELTPTVELSLTGELVQIGCVPPEGWTTLHLVRAGDSLYSLALAFDVSVDDIMAANCLESTSLSAGRQQLYLPPLPEGKTLPPARTAPLTSPSTNSPTLAVDANTVSLPAPVLVSPADGSEFAATAEVVLRWRPILGLPPDAYYAVTVAYSHLGETWFDDVPWTRNTDWTLSEHDYLLDLSDDGEFQWSVQVVRQAGVDADGLPVGEALSESSDSRKLNWKRPSEGGGRTPAGTPPVPPP